MLSIEDWQDLKDQSAAERERQRQAETSWDRRRRIEREEAADALFHWRNGSAY